ncbi:exported protein of unknown function (plasmid) [Vibrio harveyi]|uniref:hypothetical protein n=1 Tax=Vibrio harveyi TaxID=669 RepID=UPI001EFCB62B|nr:hypothetical protein [Vibrio harveyi]MCG9237413.1 hypothetical protein [Vibrio harveyi]MCG9590009.1 hypothetical protein [Vibrio harveyi]MCG9612823.1 hypothetical protein [Vibrio harveyi]MCG9671300.1 hypothetical protein [Vibrio harveyi]CAH1237675.1 exported protein of unknown function [Vibrio harveyi]
MKKTLLTTVAVTMLFSSYAMAAKVTYEDAVKSSSDFYEANNAVNKTPSPSGIGPDETQTGSSANQMGRWVVVSNVPVSHRYSGDYSIILAPHSERKQCIKGSKGLITDTNRHGEAIPDSYFRAECK